MYEQIAQVIKEAELLCERIRKMGEPLHHDKFSTIHNQSVVMNNCYNKLLNRKLQNA